MSLYNIVNPSSLVAGQPEDVSQILANYQAIQAVLNGGIDDVNVRSTAAIAPSKLAGYPSDVGKLLAGDGSWRVMPKISASGIGSGPPASPADGDIWFAGVDGAGTVWTFRYNAGSASTYKWEFVGGLGLTITNYTVPTWVVAAWTLFPGLHYLAPRAGEYSIEGGWGGQGNAGGWMNIFAAPGWGGLNETGGAIGGGASGGQGIPDNLREGNVHIGPVVGSVASGAGMDIYYYVQATPSAVRRSYMRITPKRIS